MSILKIKFACQHEDEGAGTRTLLCWLVTILFLSYIDRSEINRTRWLLQEEKSLIIGRVWVSFCYCYCYFWDWEFDSIAKYFLTFEKYKSYLIVIRYFLKLEISVSGFNNWICECEARKFFISCVFVFCVIKFYEL